MCKWGGQQQAKYRSANVPASHAVRQEPGCPLQQLLSRCRSKPHLLAETREESDIYYTHFKYCPPHNEVHTQKTIYGKSIVIYSGVKL
jgi:hypothetical protein